MIDTPQDPFEHFEPLAPVAERKRERLLGSGESRTGFTSASRFGQQGVDPLHHLLGGDIQRGQDSLHRLIFLFEQL